MKPDNVDNPAESQPDNSQLDNNQPADDQSPATELPPVSAETSDVSDEPDVAVAADSTSPDADQPTADFNFRPVQETEASVPVKTSTQEVTDEATDGDDSQAVVDEPEAAVASSAAPSFSLGSADQAPAGAPAAGPVVANAKPPKSKKKLIIAVVASVLALLVIGGGAAFAMVYNSPDNAVLDSVSKSISATSASTTTDLTVTMADGPKITATIKTDSNDQNQGLATISSKFASDGSEFDLDLALASDEFKDFYFKIDNVDKLVEQIFGAAATAETQPETQQVIDSYTNLVAPINGQWIKVSSQDIEQNTDQTNKQELECVESKYIEFRDDKSQRDEIVNLFKQHKLIDIESLGTENIDGKTANHYKLTVADDAKAQTVNLLKDLKTTQLFKNIDDCTDDDMAKELDEQIEQIESNTEADELPEGTTSSVEYWVDMWSHYPVQLKLSGQSEGSSFESVTKFTFNNNPKVELPADAKTFEQIMTEIQQQASNLQAPTANNQFQLN